MADVTQLWYDQEDGKTFLFNEISSASLFFGFKAGKLDTPAQREKCAQKIADGWIQNGQLPRGRFRIIHTKSKPIVLSKMVSDIIEKSREGITE